jgi:hypothetical protein
MTIEIGSGQDARKAPGALNWVHNGRPTRQSWAVTRQHDVVWLGIGLATFTCLLRSRRFHGQVIIGVIVVVALAGLARETRSSAFARLAAWDKARRLS